MKNNRKFFPSLACLLALALFVAGPVSAKMDDGDQPWSPLLEPFKVFFNSFAEANSDDPQAAENEEVQKPTGPPQLVADERNFDFGLIPATGTISHGFVIKNTGGSVLQIKRVSPS